MIDWSFYATGLVIALALVGLWLFVGRAYLMHRNKLGFWWNLFLTSIAVGVWMVIFTAVGTLVLAAALYFWEVG